MFLLSARDCIKYNGNLVFMTEETSLPVMLDVEKGEVRYMPISIKPDRIAPVDLAVKIGTNGFFLEVSGEHIIEYKIETAEISEYPISCHKMADGNYAFVTAEEKQILIFTSALQKLVIFDMETKKIKEVPYPDNVREIVFGCGCRCGKEVWLFPKLGGKLLCYHTDSGKYESYCLDIVLEKSIHAIRDNGCIYILTWVGEVYEFDIHNRKLEQITSLRELLKDHTVSCLFPSDGKMIILPGTDDRFYQLDIKTGEVRVLDNCWPPDVEFEKMREKWSKFYGYCEDENFYYLSNRVCSHYLRIDKNTGKLIWIKPILPNAKERIKYIQENITEVVVEEEGFLKVFVDDVPLERKIVKNRKQCTGEKIWRVISGQ